MGKQDRKKAELTGLAAALVKAGAIDEKKARELQREQRKEERSLGREGQAQREEERKAQAEQARAAEAEANRQRQVARDQAEALERARRAVEAGHLSQGGGNRRWFFVARDGRIPFLEVTGDAARLLGDGKAGIVESLGASPDRHVVVNERALTTLHAIDPELIRFWRR